MMRRGAICVWLLSCGLVAGIGTKAAWARPGVVKLHNGATYEGDVTTDARDPSIVIVKIRGIETRIPRNDIASLQYTGSFEQSFHQRLKTLAPTDVKGRLALSREAFNNSEYGLAREAAESARQADPNNADAVAMLETIQSQIRLERAKAQSRFAASAPNATTAPTTAASAASAALADQKVLDPAQINAIRQAELRPQDTAIRYRFNRDVARRYQHYENIQPSEWASMTPNQQIAELIAHGTPQMRQDVEILSDPPALLQYRRNVQPFVLQNCATMGCHGPPRARKLQLVVPGESDAATYTNFYILALYRLPRPRTEAQAGNPFAPGELRMIDRQQPERSLLLQYSLPGSMAEFRHPDIRGYKPAVRSRNDARYRALLNWIGGTLQPFQPDYGLEFTPSGPPVDLGQRQAPASAPTTGTAPPDANATGETSSPHRRGPAPPEIDVPGAVRGH